MAETEAMAEPETAPNSMEAPTSTCPRPPRARPKAASATLTSRSAMPDRCISSPAKTKKGMAISEKTLIPPAMRWNTATAGMSM